MRVRGVAFYLSLVLFAPIATGSGRSYSYDQAPDATLVVVPASDGKRGNPVEARVTWQAWPECGDHCRHATVSIAGVTATVELAPIVPQSATPGPLAISFRAHAVEPRWLGRVALQLTLPTKHVQVVGRDRRLTHTTHALLDRFDPKWLVLDGGTIAIDDPIDELVVRWEHDEVALAMAALDTDARPFSHDTHCTTNWHAPNSKVVLPLRLLLPSEELSAHALLYYNATGPAPLLIKSPFPDGRSASLTVTDHADQSSLPTLMALAFGRSDHTALDGIGTHGFAGHHLVMTKSLFAHGSDRVQLENPVMVALADVLSALGWEIIPHSATPHADERTVTAQALELFARWHARTFIDHQPETNCEGFGNRGYEAGGRYGIADLLAQFGYRYIWAEHDAPPAQLNLLSPKDLSKRASVVWPLGRIRPATPSDFWMWRASWLFVESSRFYKILAPAPLDQLEKERGMAVLHTYLESFHPPHLLYGRNNLLYAPGAKTPAQGSTTTRGLIALDPRFERVLDDLARRQERGSLWVPTLAELGDRLRATAALNVRCADAQKCTVHSDAALQGATFTLPQNVDVVWGDHPPRGLAHSAGETRFWDDLPAGDTTLTFTPTRSR